ncbi:hypothetical protein KUL42_32780 [Alteromonas sp. KUL42]|nr:hypothetical protein KUL42_32780 [Alteromonas sp. KUL42]
MKSLRVSRLKAKRLHEKIVIATKRKSEALNPRYQINDPRARVSSEAHMLREIYSIPKCEIDVTHINRTTSGKASPLIL